MPSPSDNIPDAPTPAPAPWAKKGVAYTPTFTSSKLAAKKKVGTSTKKDAELKKVFDEQLKAITSVYAAKPSPIEEIKATDLVGNLYSFDEASNKWAHAYPMSAPQPINPYPEPQAVSAPINSAPAAPSIDMIFADELDELVQPAPLKAKKAQAKPVPSLPSLLGFVQSDIPFEASEWSPDRIALAIGTQGWRERANGETILKYDLVVDVGTDGLAHYERAQGLENMVLSAEHRAELMNYSVLTCDGAVGKTHKPIVFKDTKDFTSIYDVPKGVKVNMPEDEAEAARFYGCAVLSTEYIARGKVLRVYYPTPKQMINKRFRAAFSRIFDDFSRKFFRECLKSVIPCRGQGFDVNCMRRMTRKPGISIQNIRRMLENKGKMVKGNLMPLTTKQIYDQIAAETNLDADGIKALLRRQDYQPPSHKTDYSPFTSFLDRMTERKLAPDEYKYDKAIGIEIEAISTMNAADLQRKMPHWVRVVYDGSLRDNAGGLLRPNEALSGSFEQKQKELSKGMNGKWGVEFRILIHRRDMETQINRVLGIIARCGCWVNKSCGLHVHFDMRDKTLEQAEDLADKTNAWLSNLRDLLPNDRRHNKYCAFENADNPHHEAVATDSYATHKTIEVRVHSGTISALKILNWIRLLDVLMAMPYVLPPKSSCLDALKELDLTEDARQYWLKRHHMLNTHLYPTAPDYGYFGTVELE